MRRGKDRLTTEKGEQQKKEKGCKTATRQIRGEGDIHSWTRTVSVHAQPRKGPIKGKGGRKRRGGDNPNKKKVAPGFYSWECPFAV